MVPSLGFIPLIRREYSVNKKDINWPADFSVLHGQMRKFLLTRDNGREKLRNNELLTLNPKGDRQYLFDKEIDDLLFNWLKDHFESGEVLSEESSQCRVFGETAPQYRFVCDPVDGSDNFSRRLPFSSLSLAVLSPHESIVLENVLFAMVGNLVEKSPCLAAKSKGSWQNEDRLHVSSVKHIKDAFISCELNHHQPNESLGRLIENACGIRSYGCASQAIIQVAMGTLDAHVDIRNRLTPESCLAATRILLEAGGATEIKYKNSVHEVSLTSRLSLIVAATKNLLDEIKELLED